MFSASLFIAAIGLMVNANPPHSKAHNYLLSAYLGSDSNQSNRPQFALRMCFFTLNKPATKQL